MVTAGKNDPQFALLDGLTVTGGDSNKLLYRIPGYNSPDPVLRLQLKGGDSMTGRIKRNCQLRIWLWPLTAWSVPANCADYTNTWSGKSGAFKVKCFTVKGKFR